MAYQIVKAREKTTEYFFEICPDKPCSGKDAAQHRSYTWGKGKDSSGNPTAMTEADMVAEIAALEALASAGVEVGTVLASEDPV